MHYQQLHQFFSMSGYGIYIWPAYGITFAILIINVIQPLLHHKQLLRRNLNQAHSPISRQTHVTHS